MLPSARIAIPLIAVSSVLLACGATDGDSSPRPRILGSPPLCEASGASLAPWDPMTLLIADNEVGDRVFALQSGRISLHSQSEIPIPDGRHTGDIEALAIVGGDIVVVGSHGRTGGHKLKPKRQRIQFLRRNESTGGLDSVRTIDTAPRWRVLTASPDDCLTAMFTDPPPEHAAAVCAAIVEGDALAEGAQAQPIDIEGATGVGSDRLWLGLRQPRIDGLPILLRMAAGNDEFRFDAIALIDAPRGIRSLDADPDHLWAVLGPVTPNDHTSRLWRAPASALDSSDPIRGEVVRDDLPPSSEGLVVTRDRIVVITDGAEGESPDAPCDEPASYLIFDQRTW